MKMTKKQILACFLLGSLSVSAFADTSVPDAKPYVTGVPFRGVSLSGGEFADSGNGMAPQGAFLPTSNDAALFAYKGMNIYRIPVSWEYFADINGNINAQPTYKTALDNVIQQLAAKNAMVIIDIHNYMRYNKSDVKKDYQDTDPNGSDVIGSGSAAPTAAAFANLWTNIVKSYHSPTVIYALMNEPHDIPSTLIVTNYNAAIAAIRSEETALGVKPHFIMIDGNNWTGLHSWSQSVNNQPANSTLFPKMLKDPTDNLIIEVHQYFDPDSSGTYPGGDCQKPADFELGFDTYWPQFSGWAKQNNVKVFLGEFGSPDTANCKADITHVLSALNTFADVNQSQHYGVMGWTIWSAGHAWGNYPLSVAPGGPANGLMWNKSLYENFLTANGTMPPLNPIALQVTNNSKVTLNFSSGSLPFQLPVSSNLAPGKTAYLYSDNNTDSPTEKIDLTYYINNPGNALGFGVTKTGYGYSFGGGNGVAIQKDSTCSIKPFNGDTARCYLIVNQ